MFFIELRKHKFSICTWKNWLYNLWPHHHFQYNTSFYFGFTYKNFKLLHMCLNFENTINRNININIKIENDKIKSNVQVWIIPFLIEFHKQKFHLCTSNLHCIVYGIIIINIKNIFFRVHIYSQIVAHVFELWT